MEPKTRHSWKRDCSSKFEGETVITARDAFTAIMSRRLPTNSVTVDLSEALGRTLAQDVFADLDQPPFNRVAMDGIAIHSSLLKTTTTFKLLQTIPAGSVSPSLPDGPVCFEIMTGAVLPTGSDMVIRYEDLKIVDGKAHVQVPEDKLTSNFHPQGSDYKKGDKVLSSGMKIKSTTTAILASVGHSRVQVLSLPKIAILSTGDELVDIDQYPSPEQIRWSNGISLQQELKAFDFTDVTIHKVNDSEDEIRKIMQEKLATCDVLLLTGGVSAGKFDFVPKLLKECEVKEVFHKVSQRPGKPLWFGETDRGTLVFGLPGNPVSCLVNLRKYVVPFLQYNETGKYPSLPKAILIEEVKFNQNFTYYCLVKIDNKDGKMIATPIKGNGSGDLYQLRDSDGFIELRSEEAPFMAGRESEVYLWGN
jgi:molybdopterin molybdotransferase